MMELNDPCLICNQNENIVHNVFETKSKYSNTPLAVFVERFIKVNLKEYGNSYACSECINELNVYDMSTVACKRVQEYIIQMFNDTLKQNEALWDSFKLEKPYSASCTVVPIKLEAEDMRINMYGNHFNSSDDEDSNDDTFSFVEHVQIKEEYNADENDQEDPNQANTTTKSTKKRRGRPKSKPAMSTTQRKQEERIRKRNALVSEMADKRISRLEKMKMAMRIKRKMEKPQARKRRLEENRNRKELKKLILEEKDTTKSNDPNEEFMTPRSTTTDVVSNQPDEVIETT